MEHNNKSCKYGNSVEKCGPCLYCDGFIAPKTNADRIRAMSDEELAENLTYISEVGCPYVARRCKERCRDCFLDWLQEPAEEVDDG